MSQRPSTTKGTGKAARILTTAARNRMPRIPLMHIEIGFELLYIHYYVGASRFEGQEANQQMLNRAKVIRDL